MLLRERNSVSSKGVTPDGGEEAGIEKLTTGEARSKGLKAKATPVSRDADDLFITGGVDAGKGASIGKGSGVDAADRTSVKFDSAHVSTISGRAVPSGG